MLYVMNSNISIVSNERTANTCIPATHQRAENLACLGVKTVLELCVGPSLRVLEAAYNAFGMSVAGNDIDPRWEKYYPNGKWFIGDARTIPTNGFDAVVVAPPLSRGCTGTRGDSLSVSEVFPRYTDFLRMNVPVLVLVLPGRTLSLRDDRAELHELLATCSREGWSGIEVIPLKNKVTKYVDVYLTRQN